MKKNKLYLVLAIITCLLLFTTAAVCNQCSAAEDPAPGEEEPLEEEPLEEEPLEEPPEEEPLEEEPLEEEPPDEGLSEPTIELEVYEGPVYSEADEVCYYRVKAIVTGNPTPEIEFSKDDSEGAWGSTKCQINLHDSSETYNLTATATNSQGSDTDSLDLTWGCDEEPTDDEEDLIFKSPDDEAIITLEGITLNPSDIGYLVFPEGVNTETAIIGDSTSNTEVRGYFGFNDLSSIAGREIESVTLKLNTSNVLDDPDHLLLPYITIYLGRGEEIFPLHPDAWGGAYEVMKTFNWDDEPLIWSNNPLKNTIIERAGGGSKIEFCILYSPHFGTDGDNKPDGREFTKNDIELIVEFAD